MKLFYFLDHLVSGTRGGKVDVDCKSCQPELIREIGTLDDVYDGCINCMFTSLSRLFSEINHIDWLWPIFIVIANTTSGKNDGALCFDFEDQNYLRHHHHQQQRLQQSLCKSFSLMVSFWSFTWPQSSLFLPYFISANFVHSVHVYYFYFSCELFFFIFFQLLITVCSTWSDLEKFWWFFLLRYVLLRLYTELKLSTKTETNLTINDSNDNNNNYINNSHKGDDDNDDDDDDRFIGNNRIITLKMFFSSFSSCFCVSISVSQLVTQKQNLTWLLTTFTFTMLF